MNIQPFFNTFNLAKFDSKYFNIYICRFVI